MTSLRFGTMIKMPRRVSLLTLVFAVIIGCWLIFFVCQTIHLSHQAFNKNFVKRKQIILVKDSPSFDNYTTTLNFSIVNNTEKTGLYEKNRVLCWILTNPKNHESKARVVKETWGSHCNILFFVSTESDPTLPAIHLPVREGRNQLWGKTREAFRYIWNNYRDKADWFFKADDDTFAIIENLRYFLSGFNTSQPLWFGHKFKVLVKNGYFSGGAGYVLSKEAVRRFVEEGYFDGIHCRHDHEGAEDAEMGKCMSFLNVSTMDTRDSKGRGRFFPFDLASHYYPGNIDGSYWYWKNIYYPPTKEKECCSDSTISFHYINPQRMRVLYYLIYQLRPFGMEADKRPITPEPPPDLYLNATPWYVPTPTKSSTTTTTSTTTKTISTTTKLRLESLMNSTTTSPIPTTTKLSEKIISSTTFNPNKVLNMSISVNSKTNATNQHLSNSTVILTTTKPSTTILNISANETTSSNHTIQLSTNKTD